MMGVPAKDNNLQKWRVYRGLTQSQLAKQAGLSVNKLRYIEKSTTHSISYVGVSKIANVIGVGPERIFPEMTACVHYDKK